MCVLRRIASASVLASVAPRYSRQAAGCQSVRHGSMSSKVSECWEQQCAAALDQR